MTDVVVNPIQKPSRFNWQWVLEVLIKPRRAFAAITSQNRSVWLTPILILTLTALILVVVAGPIKLQAILSGGPALPPDFEYWGPEQQAQFQKAAEATQSPVFIYVFPALLAVGGVWLGWLLVGGLLHLVLTLLGGRGSTGVSMNLVAWAALPFALRDLVRIVAMLGTHRLIENPGLAGFAPTGEAWYLVFAGKLMNLVDIYLIWHIVLVMIGVTAGIGLSRRKAMGGALVTLFLVLALQALLGYASTIFSGMSISRPFFF